MVGPGVCGGVLLNAKQEGKPRRTKACDEETKTPTQACVRNGSDAGEGRPGVAAGLK